MHIFRLRFAVWLFAAWAVVFLGAARAASWTATGAMPEARIEPTATLLPNGKVLVAGGTGASPALANAALYSPTTGIWSTTGTMPEARCCHTTTLLPNGKVLVAGGFAGGIFYDGDYHVYTSAALYDPASDTWTATGSMPEARYYHTATLLPSGKVLVTGGYDINGKVLASTALYDPTKGTWTTTGTMADARVNHTATLLPNGKVLVAGGHNGNINLASVALYDPITGTWAATGSMPDARLYHTATLLPNGKVLVAGGINNSYLASAALYTPTTGTWATTGTMPEARIGHTATLLPNGKVLVAGGSFEDVNDHVYVLASAVLYDPATGIWSATNPMTDARNFHTATLLPNGKTLISGGWDGSFSPAHYLFSAELYTPDTGGPKDPDFTVTAITLTPISPTPNTPFTATITVKNQGKTAGSGGQLSIWTNQSKTQTCGATADQSAVIGTLAAGASKTLTLSGLQATKTGALTFRAFADGLCATLESNEANNQRTLAYRVRGSQPDFVISAITLNPASPKTNTTFTATVTVKNQGTAAGSVGYLDIWADQPSTQECGAEGDAWAGISTLNPGATKTVTLKLIAGTPGTKTLRAFANSWCGLGESNQTNNQLGKSYTVQ